jgi:hypothetical protein
MKRSVIEAAQALAQFVPDSVKTGSALLLATLVTGYGADRITGESQAQTDPHPTVVEPKLHTDPHPIVIERKDPNAFTFAHRALGLYGANRVTEADKAIALSTFSIRPLRVTRTREGDIKPFYGRVKDGPYEEADIHVSAAAEQARFDEYSRDNCLAESTGGPFYAIAHGRDVVNIYTVAKGFTRVITTTYEPGDKYLHASMGDVPSGVDHRDETFTVFNGKQYYLQGEHKILRDGSLGGNNLRLQIPPEVGTPPPIIYDRYSC